ncbi:MULTISPECIES: response regulator transcription factor [Streptomyces]
MADLPRPDADPELLAELGPLRTVVTDTLATVPIRLGQPGSIYQLADQLTLALAVHIARDVLPAGALTTGRPPRPCEHCRPLAPKDLKVIAGLARGHQLAQIGADLKTPARTLRNRTGRLARRLGLAGAPSPSLVNYAYQHGYLAALAPEPRDHLRPLTATETQTLEHIAQGLSVEQAASHLVISRHTLNSRRRALYLRLSAHTAAHAVALGWQHGLLTRQQQ